MLQAINLECQRGDNLLFEKLNFNIQPGTILQIEGANGSGKTSLLRILAGLSPPLAGEVQWRGLPVSGSHRSAYLAEMAYLGHHLGLKSELTVSENLHFAFGIRGRALDKAEESAALSEVGLSDRSDLKVRVLSEGQKQRVALARVLALGAAFWVLDEPLTAMDAEGIDLVQNLMDRHTRNGGLVVLSSHQTLSLTHQLRKLVLQ